MPIGKRCRKEPDSEQPKTVSPISAEQQDSNKRDIAAVFQEEEPKYSFDDIILNSKVYDAIQDVLVIYEKRDLLSDLKNAAHCMGYSDTYIDLLLSEGYAADEIEEMLYCGA